MNDPANNKKRRVRDREATKADILDAAEEEFGKSGLAGARIDAIADRTGVTKAMIYYYFKSKEALYQEVFQRLVRVASSSSFENGSKFSDRLRSISSL